MCWEFDQCLFSSLGCQFPRAGPCLMNSLLGQGKWKFHTRLFCGIQWRTVNLRCYRLTWWEPTFMGPFAIFWTPYTGILSDHHCLQRRNWSLPARVPLVAKWQGQDSDPYVQEGSPRSCPACFPPKAKKRQNWSGKSFPLESLITLAIFTSTIARSLPVPRHFGHF